MLDQNTDRMWYVIGAVIIGAAIILILNNTFPQLFASIGETFKGKTEQTTEVVDGIMPKQRNGIVIDNVSYGLWIDHRTGEEQTIINSAHLYASSDYMSVKPDTEYGFKMTSGTVVHNLRIVYFDADYAFISGFVSATNTESQLVKTSPSTAVYARVSAPYMESALPHAPIREWWFGPTK